MSPQAFPANGMEYRLSKYELEVGVVSALLFGLMGIVSTVVALLNADGSFQHPVAAAVIVGSLWSCMTLLGCWLILTFWRHRLFAGPEFVRVTDCFRTREVRFASVTHAVWKSFLKDGTLVLYETSGSVKIRFGNYTVQERSELIQFFRTALAEHIQQGWEHFESRWIPSSVDYNALRRKIHGHLRFAVTAWVATFPMMYAILIWQKLTDGLPDRSWVFVATLPLAIAGAMVGVMWFAARGDLARARGRHDAG